MMKIILTFLILILFQSISFGYTRDIRLDKELKEATLIKEIVIINYTSRIDTLPYQEPVGISKVIDKMIYIYLDNPDSILTYSPPYTGLVNATPYFDIAKNDSSFNPKVSEGYWPPIGDTVLVVFNTEKKITLFAELIKTNKIEYKFWSPYHTSSWNTIFYFNAPFKPIKPTNPKSFYSKIWNNLQERAKRQGYQFASQFHSIIDKKEFWIYIDNIKKE